MPYEWDLSDTSHIARDTFLSIILLFNLALSCQLGAVHEFHARQPLRRSDKCIQRSDPYSLVRTLLRRAEHTYGICLALLKHHEEDHSACGIPPLFRLAVANNRGVVCVQLNELESATMCFEICMSILAVFVDRQNQDYLPDFEGYLNNACRRWPSQGVIIAEAA